MLDVELRIFRMLAIFGVQTVDAVCFRCVDGQYRRHMRSNPEVKLVVSEKDAFEQFFRRGRRLSSIMWTVLPSRFRRLFSR